MSTTEVNNEKVAPDGPKNAKNVGDMDSVNEYPMDGYPQEQKLVRQLKNRHIAMISSVASPFFP